MAEELSALQESLCCMESVEISKSNLTYMPYLIRPLLTAGIISLLGNFTMLYQLLKT